MATKKKAKSGGRGSAEAIAKRRAARQLNAILTGAGSQPKLDGRTEKRRQRLIKELKDGKGGSPLKPIDMVTHMNELLALGETVASVKKQGVKPVSTPLSSEVEEVVESTQQAYEFNTEAWRILGLRVSEDGKIVHRKPRGPNKKRATKKRASKKK